MSYCAVCSRVLSRQESIQRGIDPICYEKILQKFFEMGNNGIEEVYLESSPEKEGFIFERTKDGIVITNLPHIVTVHSPTGFEWGYAGSGPAETALNVLEFVVRQQLLDKERVEIWSGVFCTWLAWINHQEFKRTFIANLSQEQPSKEIIPYSVVLDWLLSKRDTERAEQLELPL